MNKDTLSKCQRILSLFDELHPRPYTIHPKRKSSSSEHSATSPGRHEYSFKKLQSSKKSLKSNSSKSRLKSQSQSRHLKTNNSFVSPYDRESRFEKIMRLKVPPQVRLSNTSASRISLSSVDKENRFVNGESQKKLSRFQRIMKLKVPKPITNSYLSTYHPKKVNPSPHPKPRQPSPIVQLRQCRKKTDKVNRQADREDRLWKNFEREREKSLISKSKQHEKQEMQQRRIERKLESMVAKELARIEADRDSQYHRKKAYSQQLFG